MKEEDNHRRQRSPRDDAMNDIGSRNFGPWVGRSIKRREDQRLLTGQGQFVADIVLPKMLHAVLVRSPLAHAHIRSVDVSAASKAPGVVHAMNAADLLALLPPVPEGQISLPPKWTTQIQHKFLNPSEPLLAHDKARHVGEALAIIVAETRHQAEDAAELVTLDLEELPAVVDPEAALKPDSPIVHDRYSTNLIGEFTVGRGDAAGLMAKAPHRLKRRFYHHRYAAVPMETRGVLADYDRRTDSVTIWSSTQVVHWVRREAAALLGIPEARVRCIAPDVGGGFGGKGHVYPEDMLLTFLARRLGRPVKWIEGRSEHLQSATHSRDQLHDIEVGFDGSGRILALTDDYIVDCGAWNPIGSAVAYNTAVHLTGPYKIENYAARGRVVVSNKVPNAPYRGAGRPEAAFAMERTIDLIARTLGIEPAEVRRRNIIPAGEMPYKVGMPYRDGEPIVYDSGDYPTALEKALNAVGGVEAFRARQAEARKAGRHLGLGIGFYIEGTGVGPFESAFVRVDPSGKIYISGGAAPQGQGMETIFAQITADLWKVKPDDVVVSLADTASIAIGFGTMASRSTVTLSGALFHASERLKEKVFSIAANILECAPADLELRDGGVGITGVPGKTLTLSRIARAAMPNWTNDRPPGVDAGLEETFYWQPPTVTWSYAVHVAIVEVDAETGRVRIDNYAVAHDCGNVVNPMLVEGQIHGGAVQGLGGILCEAITYDTNGQLLSGSFMDYAMPIAAEMPDFKIVHMHSPSPLNPLGVKGVGEGGAVAPPAAIANAVCDALAGLGLEINATPVRPAEIAKLARGLRPQAA
jgi:carbon-monoxide dehydrogenase large subunit